MTYVSEKSEKLFSMATKYIPGGVNSPVRAFGAIGSTPPFIVRADQAYMWDQDGNRYIDFIGSWGPMILGHNHPVIREAVEKACQDGLSFGAVTKAEVDMAQLICETIPSIDMVRMVNSGTEAVMSAIRVARGFTKRDKIIKFNGCYHGHSDGLLVQAGSGVMTSGVPDSAGVPVSVTRDTLTAEYNNLESVQAQFDRFGDEIAAVVVEPVAANMGVVLPKEGFLQGLRDICTLHGSLLIFDEVITGFRLSLTGAQGYYGITPDLTTFGKIIGAGMPVGAYGGRRDIMEQVAPCGKVYQAGTLSGNPVAMAAGLAQLTLLKKHPEYYTELNETSDNFFESIRAILQKKDLPYALNHIGSLGSLFFTGQNVTDYASAKTADTDAYARYCTNMIHAGVYIAPAQFEAMFLSTAHTSKDLQTTLKIIENSLNNNN
jgi:glutamate-1-semialdehyde 2,1-aminomutase